jgi:alpha-beta hydrolase superfamily lysophospholipase
MATKDELAERTRIKFHFGHDDYDFFLQWGCGGQTHGATEVGESFYAASQIKDGDSESWASEWTALAQRVEARAKVSLDGGHLVSARDAYFRAYYYYRSSLVFMDPKVPGYAEIYETAKGCFRKAAALNDSPIVPIDIPFENGSLTGYFIQPSEDKNARKTLLMFGGGDTFVEDLYYYIAPAGIKRDYNVVIVDLPGQGMLPAKGLFMPAAAEVPMKAIVDHVLSYPQVDSEKLAAFGISAGGYLVPRAATVEKRIKACVASSAILNFYDVWVENAGLGKIAKLENSWLMALLKKLPVKKLQKASRLLNTYCWRWGVDTVSELLEESKKFVFDPSDITCPTLVLIGEQEYDHFEFSKKWAHETVENVSSSNRKLIVTPQNEGADGHAIGTNLSLMSQFVFDWLDEVFE